MKIMHLSDLHLGKSILEQSLIDDQKYILDQICNIVIEKKVDVVLIAGDVYDKHIPNVEAVRLFSSFLAYLYENDVKVFIIAGNHDSKDRLSFGNELFVDNGVYIEGIFNGELKYVELKDEWGKINIYMLPFVKPIDVKSYYSNEEISSYHDAIATIINNTVIDKEERNIILVHQFVTATDVEVLRSDSETLSLGGIDNVDVSIFDDFDYVAMGHVHRGQKLLRDTVRYAGSPLKYSFSEVNHNKSVVVIDLKEKGNIGIELVALVPIRDMRIIKGNLENLIDLEVVSSANKDDYINAIITDEDYVVDAIGKLRNVYKNVLKLEYHNKRTAINDNNFESKNIEKKSELDLFSEFYERQNNILLDDDRLDIVKSIIKECLDKEN